MENKDTINLLKECDAGAKMAVSSIDEVLEKVQDEKLEKLLSKCKTEHEKLGNKIHSLLVEYNSEQKEPSPIAKGMSWLKTNYKIGMDESDSTIADLITDGCDMGVKSLNRYLNQYPTANQTVKDICTDLIGLEELLGKEMRAYL